MPVNKNSFQNFYSPSAIIWYNLLQDLNPDRMVTRMNFPETWLWTDMTAGYLLQINLTFSLVMIFQSLGSISTLLLNIHLAVKYPIGC